MTSMRYERRELDEPPAHAGSGRALLLAGEERLDLDLLLLLLLEDMVDRAQDARLLRAADRLAGERRADRALRDRTPAAGLLPAFLLLRAVLALPGQAPLQADLAILRLKLLELLRRGENPTR